MGRGHGIKGMEGVWGEGMEKVLGERGGEKLDEGQVKRSGGSRKEEGEDDEEQQCKIRVYTSLFPHTQCCQSSLPGQVQGETLWDQ